MSQKIYIAVNNSGKPFMFVDMPQKTTKSWTGNFYVNSVLYVQVCDLIKQANMTHDSEPEMIEFQIQKNS